MKEQNLTAKLNEQIKISGTAENARLGAIVMTEDFTSIFLSGINEWDNNVEGKSVVVTGLLRRKLLAPKATVGPNGEISHGVGGDSFVLENPTWTDNE